MSALLRTVHAHPRVQRALAIVGSPTARLLLTAALIGFGLSQIPLADVAQRLEDANLWLVAGGTLLLLLGQALSGQRWRRLALFLGMHAPQRWFVAAYLRGCFYNSVLPTGIGGDAIRVAMLRPLGSWGIAARSVVIDRVSGFAALALAAGLLLPVAGLGLPAQLTWAGAGASVALLVAALVYCARSGLVRWAGWTLAYELVWFGGVWLLARALAIPMGWATPAVVLIVGIAMALPISFGGHGAREAGFVLALAPLGVEADQAVALGVLFGGALALVGLAGALVRVPQLAVPTPSGPSAVAAVPLPSMHGAIGGRS